MPMLWLVCFVVLFAAVLLAVSVGLKYFETRRKRQVANMLQTASGEPVVTINVRTAKALGIEDGELVTVESPRGSIKVKAKVTEDIHEKVVSLPHGWIEANVNLLTDDEARDPISGYPAFRTGLCRVRKA